MRVPIHDSYWVEPGRFLAGEYPGAREDADAIPRLALFRKAGVTSFIDLTEERERLTPYQQLLAGGMRFTRTAIADGGCPTPDQMRATLDLIDDEVGRGEVVYLHCWGGHGRTGTVVGCWLVRHGLSGAEALNRVQELRREVPDALTHASPETEPQRRMILGWGQLDA